jgi:hypothetical protein
MAQRADKHGLLTPGLLRQRCRLALSRRGLGFRVRLLALPLVFASFAFGCASRLFRSFPLCCGLALQ